jgi:chitin deacetylase
VADRHPFVWQRSLSIAAVTAALGFVAGCTLPVGRSANKEIIIPISLSLQQQSAKPKTSEVKALVAQQDELYEKVVAKFAEAQTVKQLNFPVPVQFQGKTIQDVKVNSAQKVVALTFDDGPWENSTSKVLGVLKKNNVKATFFVVGKQVERHPQMLKQMVANGHAIGNHTWSHQYHHFNQSTAAREIDNTASLVYKITGVKTSLFRPPAGILGNGLAAYAHQKKYAVVMWSVDSKDWRSWHMTPQRMVGSIVKDAKPGGIILLHDGGGDRSHTVQALPKLIAQLKKRGYKFVTVPELLKMQDKKLKPLKS